MVENSLVMKDPEGHIVMWEPPYVTLVKDDESKFRQATYCHKCERKYFGEQLRKLERVKD